MQLIPNLLREWADTGCSSRGSLWSSWVRQRRVQLTGLDGKAYYLLICFVKQLVTSHHMRADLHSSKLDILLWMNEVCLEPKGAKKELADHQMFVWLSLDQISRPWHSLNWSFPQVMKAGGNHFVLVKWQPTKKNKFAVNWEEINLWS